MRAIMTVGGRVVVGLRDNPRYSRRRRPRAEQARCRRGSQRETGLWLTTSAARVTTLEAMADNQRNSTRRQREIPRLFGLVLLAEAATLGIASYLHRDGHIALGFTVIHGEQFTGASVPEAIIGAVLATGAVIVLTAPARARRAAVFAAGFGVFGVLAGIFSVLTSGRPSVTIDLTYHSILLAALITTLVMLALWRPRVASGQAPERQRVRSR
jgi:hypothetical protein